MAQAIAGRGGAWCTRSNRRLLNDALCGSAALNDIGNLIVHRFGLTASRSVMHVPLQDYLQPSDFGTVQWQAAQGPPGDAVEVLALDEMGLQRLDFLKLDIEGMEVEALRGARSLIAADQPGCWIDYWKTGVETIGRESVGLDYEFFKADALSLLWAPLRRWDRQGLPILSLSLFLAANPEPPSTPSLKNNPPE